MTTQLTPLTQPARTTPQPSTRSTVGWLKTINPLIKLAATFPPLVALFFTRDIYNPGIVAVLAVIILLCGMRIKIKVFVITAACLLIFGAWMTLLFALLVRQDLVADSPPVIDTWITLNQDALEIGAATALRLVAAMLLALLGSGGTTINSLSSAMVRQAHLPYRFAHGTLVAARFVPYYQRELHTLHAAHRARGIIDRRGPLGLLRRTGRSAAPLLAGGVRYAERISLAMDARGFGSYRTRTDRNPARIRLRDGVFLLTVYALYIAVFITTDSLGIAQWTDSMNAAV